MADWFSSIVLCFEQKKKRIGLNDREFDCKWLLHVCSIMNHKWNDLVLANCFQED